MFKNVSFYEPLRSNIQKVSPFENKIKSIKLKHSKGQCCGSALLSIQMPIRIRIQLHISKSDPDQDPGRQSNLDPCKQRLHINLYLELGSLK